MSDWTLYMRDPQLRRVAEIDDFQQLEVLSKFNDVGTFSLEMDQRNSLVPWLATPGYGIYAVHNDTGRVLLSGPVLGRKHDREQMKHTLTLTGADDNVLLKRRVAHPSPSESTPPYSVQSHHEVSGVCSTVLREYVDKNLGPGAISVRRIPNFELEDTDPLLGSEVSGKLRWADLLEELQKLAIAGGDLGFRCVQTNDGTIQFQVYEPVDRTRSVVFSEGYGNLVSYSLEAVAPEATYVYIGGQGEQEERTVVEEKDVDAIDKWFRYEVFEDRRDSAEESEIREEATEVFAEKGEQTKLSVAPIDIAGMSYGVHYNLGDRVTVSLGSADEPESFGAGSDFQFQEVVREVKLVMDMDSPHRLTPTVATPGKPDALRIFQELRRHASRISRLERR